MRSNKNHPKQHYLREELEYIWDQVPPDYYQKGVSGNFLQRQWHTGKLKTILALIEGFDPSNILDVGCASGWFLSEIAKKYPMASCTGIDVYEKAIQYGKKIYPSLRLMSADAHALPFSDNSFDLVICTEVLEHVLRPEQVIKEIRRVLKPGGITIIEMDTGNVLFNAIWYWWTHLRKGVWKDSHLHAFNTKKLENMIKRDGLIITKKKIFNLTMAVAFQFEKRVKK